jgi:pimeloyl-ACP methyl ester carboxylesterase
MVQYQYAYPFPVKRIEIAHDIEMAYMEAGRGRTSLLFLHGMGSYAPAWNKMIPWLSDTYHCLALDLPNYGLSKKGSYAFTIPFFAECVETFIQRLNLERVVLVGHSMGGQIALTMALRKRVSIQQLVLLAPAGFEQFSKADKALFKHLVTPNSLLSLSIGQITRNFDLNFANKKLPSDANFMLGDRIRLRHDAPKDYAAFCRMTVSCARGMLESPVFDRLKEVNLPTLIFFGQEDWLIPNRLLHPTLTPQMVAEAGHAQMPNSQLYMLPSCGHFVPWECPREVSHGILEFLK